MRRQRFRRGDVVLAVVPYATPTGSKFRPAVVISSNAYRTAHPANVIVVGITGNVAAHRTAVDYVLQDWKAAGLHRPSVVAGFIYTIAPAEIHATIGRLSDRDLQGVAARLRLSLDLP